jgi:hypothetical protein
MIDFELNWSCYFITLKLNELDPELCNKIKSYFYYLLNELNCLIEREDETIVIYYRVAIKMDYEKFMKIWNPIEDYINHINNFLSK